MGHSLLVHMENFPRGVLEIINKVKSFYLIQAVDDQCCMRSPSRLADGVFKCHDHAYMVYGPLYPRLRHPLARAHPLKANLHAPLFF